MKVIGETKIGEGYAKKDALVCIISIDELKKVADKAGYRSEFDPPAVGSDYPIDQGFDFRSQLSDSIRLMREAYEKFSKVAPVAAEFAGLVAKHEHGGGS